MGSRSLRFPLSYSLGLHAFLFLAFFLLFQNQALRNPARPTTWIELETSPLDPKELAKRLREEQARKQIVQTDRGQIVQQAVPDAFLGEKNQKVDRETVSKEHKIAMAQPRPPTPSKSHEKAPPEKAERTGDRNQAEVKAERVLSRLGAPILPMARLGTTLPPDFDDNHHWADYGNLPHDYVRGLKESERTALNTKEYVFYGYFQRIRERLDRAWVPILRERLVKMYRVGRQLASDMDHITQVMVVLNPQGEIVRVQVMSESGTRDLDDAAVRAFNQAGPFPNPPKGIVDPNGEIQIPWQFILKT